MSSQSRTDQSRTDQSRTDQSRPRRRSAAVVLSPLAALLVVPAAAVALAATPAPAYAHQADSRTAAQTAAQTAMMMPPLEDTTPPAVPTGLRVVEVGSTSMTLGWDQPADPGDVADYLVYRSQTGGMPVIAVVPVASAGRPPRVTFSMLTPATTYTIQVGARDAVGNTSRYGSVLSVTTPAAAARCQVHDTLLSSWNTGYNAMVTITCDRDTTIRGWQVRWSIPRVVSLAAAWGATIVLDGTWATASSASWNSTITGGVPVRFGFTAVTSGEPVPPSTFTFIGEPVQAQP